MREITTHVVEGKGGGNDNTRICVLDEPGQGGASHRYDITGIDTASNPAATAPDGYVASYSRLPIIFQNGPIQDVGVNGVQQEHLLAIVEDRLASFQAGPFANDYNAEALCHVRLALAALHLRTTDRITRGVEGYNKA